MGDQPAGPQGGGRPASLPFPSQESRHLLLRRLSKPVKRILNFLPPLAGRAGVPSAARAWEPGRSAEVSVTPAGPTGCGQWAQPLPTPPTCPAGSRPLGPRP